MTDRAYADEINGQVDRLTEEYGARAEKVLADIYGRYA